MTPAQLLLIKAEIDADGTLNALPMTPDGAFAIADALNLDAAPAWVVWKSAVLVDDIMQDMDWTRVDNLSNGKARSWDWMTKAGTINAGRANIRAGIDSVWVGTAPDLAVRAAIYVRCKRAATRAEKILSMGTGTDTVPATMGFEGAVSYRDVEQARAA